MNGLGGFFAGSIFAKLTLDKSGWNKSVGSISQDEKAIKGMSDRMTANFKKIGSGMTIAGAAVVGAFGSMVNSFVKTGDELDKMSKRTGLSTTALSELKHAANITGADLSDLEKGVKKMSKSIVDGEAGMTTYTRAFKRLGIPIESIIDLSPEEQFMAIGEALAEMENPTERTATAMDIFGRAGTQLIPLFSEGKEGLKGLREEAHELGIVFDEEAAASAAKLQDEQTRLKGSLQGLGIQIAQVLVPVLSSLTEKITSVITKVKNWMEAHPGLTSVITKVVGGIGALMVALGPLVMILPKLITGFTTLGSTLGKLGSAKVGPLFLVAGGIALIASEAKKVIGNVKEMNATLDDIAIAKGEKKVSGFTKALNVLNGVAQRFTGRLVDTKHKQALLNQELEKSREEVKEKYGPAYEAFSSIIKDKVGGAFSGFKNVLGMFKTKEKETVDETDNLEEAITDLGTATEDTKDKTEEYKGILHDLGILTVTETKEEIDNLKGALEFFDEQLANGEITLDEYKIAVENVENKIKDLSTTYTYTAIPAARAFHEDVLANAPATLETQYFTPMETKTDEMTGSMTTSFNTFTIDSGGLVSGFFDDILTKGTGFKGAFENLWGNIKTAFSNILSSMVTSFTSGFINKILGSLSGFGGSFKSGLSTILGGATGPGGLIGTVIGGALGGFLSKLFGGGGLSKAGMNEHLYRIHDRLQEIKDFLFIDVRTYMIQAWTVLFNQHKDLYIHEFDELHKLGINRNAELRTIRKIIQGLDFRDKEDKKKKKKKQKYGKADVPPGTPFIIDKADIDLPSIPGMIGPKGKKGGWGIVGPGGEIGTGGLGGAFNLPTPPTPTIPDIPIEPGEGFKKVVKKIINFKVESITINLEGIGIEDNPKRFVRDKLMPEFINALELQIHKKRFQTALDIS